MLKLFIKIFEREEVLIYLSKTMKLSPWGIISSTRYINKIRYSPPVSVAL